MYPELYQYLLYYKQLPVPGIGTFSLERTPAVVDFPNKMVYAPKYSFALKEQESAPSKKLYCWLGSLLNIPERDAVIRFNEFAFDLKRELEEGFIIDWDGVGSFKRGVTGSIQFTPVAAIGADPVPAVKVLREKAEHSIRVGEDQRSSVEMVEMLSRTTERRSFWWVWALAIGLLALIFTGWYFSQHGVDPAATGNSNKLIPVETTPSYRHLP